VTNPDIAAPDPTLIVPSGDLLTPDQFDADMLLALAEIDQAAGDEAASLRADSSNTAYGDDWRDWCRFTAEHRIPRLAVTSGTLYAFVKWLWEQPGWRGQKMAPSTIDGRLSGVVVIARERYKVPLDRGVTANARKLLAHLVKAMQKTGEKRGRGKANPFEPDHMHQALAKLPETPDGIRDRSINLVHFNVAGREHELSHLRVRDFIRIGSRGMDVDLRVSKTAPRIDFVEHEHSVPGMCAVCSTFEWFDVAGIADDPDGFAYRRCHARWKTPMLKHGLSPEAIGDVIERTGARVAGAPRVTGHSPRRGYAQAARDAGVDREKIAKQGGWVNGSKAMESYFDEADRHKASPSAGLLGRPSS
jgi:hypothetical protein